jgi:hypothetical protein
MTMLIPVYVHPTVDPASWQAVAAAGSTVTAIVNVHDGPGRQLEPAYQAVTEQLRAAQTPMIGYVDLDYGNRAAAEIEEDLVGWQRYPVQGIFFDQAPTVPSALSTVARYVHRAQGIVVLNPGTPPHPAYAALTDLICTFEGPWSTYRQLPDEPDWPNAAHLVYGAPPADFGDAHARLARLTGGVGLISDLDAPLPYCGTPSWLAAATVNQ